MNCQLGLCLAVANLPRRRGVRGMVKGFLTACFADAIGGRDPKIGRAGVKHHGEPLRRRAHAHNSIILRLGGGQSGQPHSVPLAAAAEEQVGPGTRCGTSSRSAVQVQLNVSTHHLCQEGNHFWLWLSLFK